MIDIRTTAPLQLRFRPNAAMLLRGAVDPLVALVCLGAAALWFDERMDHEYLVLAPLVFAMMFPGSLAREEAGGARAGQVFGAWCTIVPLLLLLGWASQTLSAFAPRALLAWALTSPFAILVAHRALDFFLPRLLRVQRVAVIAGANELGSRLAQRVETDAELGIRIAGYFDDRDAGRLEQITPERALGRLDQLAAYVNRNHVDVIYITLPMCSQPRILRLLEQLHDTTASIYFVPDIFVYDLIQARVDSIGGVPALAVCESPFVGFDALVKRASDLVLAGVLLAALAPLLLAIAVGVKLSSPGPVLFRQRRCGLDGHEILVYKFRSMTVCEDGERVAQATRDDPRITRFGGFLRRYSLDELPQFINVLQGRMSVVGPRPHAVAHNELYRKLIRGYMIRHKARPGITGLAQVNGLRGETDSIDKMRARIECDLAYLRAWSLLLDLRIVLRTIPAVLGRENAY